MKHARPFIILLLHCTTALQVPRRHFLESTAAVCLGSAPLAAAAGGQPGRALVTGASSGIGEACAAALASKGWEVWLGCRTIEKADAAAARIAAAAAEMSDAGGETLRARVRRPSAAALELGDLRAVSSFSSAVRDELPKGGFDALLLVAGVDGVRAGAADARTAQGHERHFGVNHLAHFALYRALQRDALLEGGDASAPARVVAVSSEACLDARPALDDLDWRRRGARYDPHVAYADSKACNVLFADELARRARAGGGDGARARAVTGAAVFPGKCATMIVRYELPQRAAQREGMDRAQLTRQARQLGLRLPAEGAAGAVWLAAGGAAPNAAETLWLDPQQPASPLPVAWREETVARELWGLSEELVAPFL